MGEREVPHNVQTMIAPYPKIFAIGTQYIQNIFLDDVEITEKVDGSQFGWGKVNGKLCYRSKGKELYDGAIDKMFLNAVAFAQNIEHLIPDNTIFYGEYLDRPKHNTLAYSRTPANKIAIFGGYHLGNPFMVHEEICHWASVFCCDTVPMLHRGRVSSIEDLRHFLDQESYLGGAKIEGIVVKNYAQAFLLGGQPIPFMAGKYVSEAFKETNRTSWSKENTTAGKWATFLDEFRTEARWQKAVQHLRESGQLTGEPKDIGPLIKEVQKDITEEEREYIRDFLWGHFKGDILRRAVAGLPEWYKQTLMEGSLFAKE